MKRPPSEARFWDRVFMIAYADALRHRKHTDSGRITWAAARADGALAERRRSLRLETREKQ